MPVLFSLNIVVLGATQLKGYVMQRKLLVILTTMSNLLTVVGCSSMGYNINLWDYLTFIVLFLGVVAFLVALVWVLGLPGRIAIARRHPEAEAVNLMGWVGFMAIVPWIQALIWAFKPTDVVDIRYFPREEAQHIDGMIAKLGGKPVSDKAPEPPKGGEDTKGIADKRE